MAETDWFNKPVENSRELILKEAFKLFLQRNVEKVTVPELERVTKLQRGAIFYHFKDRRTYTLNLPQLEKLESISLNQNEKDISINGREEMKDILYVLNGTKRVTKNESIQDAPVNIDDEIKVDFHFIEAGVSTIFVYNKNNSYYIEQPYNGIYQISGDEYNSIEKLVR